MKTIARLLALSLGVFSLPAAEKPAPNPAQAQAQVKLLVNAVDNYTLEYDRPPLKGDKDALANNADVLRVLLAVAKGANADHLLNPRQVKYLDDRGYQFKDDALLDPWGNPYLIMIDYDHDDALTIGEVKIKAGAAVWSCGPNGVDDKGQGDDIVFLEK